MWDSIFEEAVAIEVQNDVHLLPVQRLLDDDAIQETFLEIVHQNNGSEIYIIPFVDHLVNELSNCLVQNENRFSAQYILSSQIGNITRAKMTELYDTFGEDLPANDSNEFQREAKTRNSWRDFALY